MPTGARSQWKPRLATMPAMCEASPQRGLASSTITRRPVFFTDSRMVSSSSGDTVRRSITSASMPSLARVSAAFKACTAVRLTPSNVTSLPGRATAALPMGTMCSPPGTSPFRVYMVMCSQKMTGSSSRMEAVSRPLASAALEGATTFKPGMLANMG